jgi:hypothetical protein
LLVVGYCPPFEGGLGGLLVFSCWLLVIGFSNNNQQPTNNNQQTTTNKQQPTNNNQLTTTN